MIDKHLSEKIITLGVSKTTYGGMSSVLVSYEKGFQKMRFIPTWRLGNKLTKGFYAFQALLRCYFVLMFDNRISILHIHGAANASFYRKSKFIKLGKRFNKKVILHEHAADFEAFFNNSNNKKEIVEIINSCDRLIVLSSYWKEYFINIGVNRHIINILNNIVIPPKTILKKNASDKINILYLGEISHRKGIYDLLLTLYNHREVFKDKIRLRIGGNCVDGDINQYINDKNLSSFVKYEGWVAGEKKEECLSSTDIYILPSYNEGLPIAILEAMSYSHPIISTKVGGIPEVVHPYVNGILVEPGNEEQIKDAILYFINNPHKINDFGKNAYKLVVPYFPENVFNNLELIYNELG